MSPRRDKRQLVAVILWHLKNYPVYRPWAFKDFVPLPQIREVQLWKMSILFPLLFGGGGRRQEPVSVQWLCERCREHDGGAPKSAVCCSLHMECQRGQAHIIELFYAMRVKRFEIPQRASGKRQQKQLSFYFGKYKILQLTKSNHLF